MTLYRFDVPAARIIKLINFFLFEKTRRSMTERIVEFWPIRFATMTTFTSFRIACGFFLDGISYRRDSTYEALNEAVR